MSALKTNDPIHEAIHSYILSMDPPRVVIEGKEVDCAIIESFKGKHVVFTKDGIFINDDVERHDEAMKGLFDE